MSCEVGRYRRAFPRIFRHPGFQALTPTGRMLALYLLCGPQSNRIGLFYLSVNTAAEDLNASMDTIRKGLADLAEAFGWLFDATARVAYIPTWWRWNNPGSPKVLQGNLKDLSEIPPCGLVDAFAVNTRYISDSLADTFRQEITIRIPKSTPTQYHYQDQEQEQKQEPSALRTGSDGQRSNEESIAAEIRAIAKEAVRFCGNNVDHEILRDHFWNFWNRSYNGKAPEREHVHRALHEARLEYRRPA
jgi:hypothetical protein